MTWRLVAVTAVAVCCAHFVGCSPAPEKNVSPALQPQTDKSAAEQQPAAEPSTPRIQYISAEDPAQGTQAVVVEGYALAHTRQILPVDQDGNLVGKDAAQEQIAQVLKNLQSALGAAGTDLTKLVRLNVYADSPQSIEMARQQLDKQLDGSSPPVITAVITPLSKQDALVAVDAVAITPQTALEVKLQQSAELSSGDQCADVAIAPAGGMVYLSGQPERGPLGPAAAKSLTKQLTYLAELKLTPSHVVQIKAFVTSVADAQEVLAEVKKAFPGQMAPPVVFVQWIASAPVEIEMVAAQPLPHARSLEGVRFPVPVGVKASPTFSRLGVVDTDRQIYITGLSAQNDNAGDAQVRSVFEQLQQILTKTGSDMQHLAKATYYVSDDNASKMLDKLRPEFYDPQRPPAASKAKVAGLAKSNYGLTVDMIAVVHP